MAFMKPYTYEGPYTVATDKRFDETWIIPDHETPDEATSVEHKTGLIWCLSAAGYLDQTEWQEADSMEAARDYCETMYNVCFDCGEDLGDSEACPACRTIA